MALLLTSGLVGQTDVNRLLRELSSLNDFFVQAAAREAGTSIKPPRTTQQLEDLAKLNKLNLLAGADRTKLSALLQELLTKAPKLQISFAVDPPPKVLETVLTWLRHNIDPRILLQVGLQPNIGAGCVLRTPNREFDLSMRQHLIGAKTYLAGLIEAAAKKHSQPVAPAVPVVTAGSRQGSSPPAPVVRPEVNTPQPSPNQGSPHEP